MGFEGDILNYSPADLDFTEVQAVIVSGEKPNFCGHALLFAPFIDNHNEGLYFQVVGNPTPKRLTWPEMALLGLGGAAATALLRKVVWYPLMMDAAGYRRYMHESGKTELGRLGYTLSNPDAAINRLIELMQQKWAWGAIVHNCASFVEHIVRTGGGLIFMNKCPVKNLPDRS